MSASPVTSARFCLGRAGLPLSSIAPGEYLIDVRAAGQGGEAKHLVAFKVVS